MQNATITDEKETLLKERFPSIVDTDDLIFELGKQTIKILNLEKLLNNLLKKITTTEQMAADFSKAKSDTTKKINTLKESNKLYEENNRRLDSETVRLKVFYDEKIKKLESDLEKVLKKKKQSSKKKV